MKVGLLVHAGRDASVAAAADAARLLHGLGAQAVVPDSDEGWPVSDELASVASVVDVGRFATEVDLAMSFGGDGTFLRAAHLCRDADVPILGVNLGRLGFLAEVELDDLGPALRAVVDGSYVVEDRPTLEAEIEEPDGGARTRCWALNEVAVEKTARQRLLHLDVSVAGTLFARVPADALILATATGSTAYALSAGGPLVSPKVEATLVVPVAPHTLFDRTVVAAPDEVVRVELSAEQAPALVSPDGREPIELAPGGIVSVWGGGRPVRLARVGLLDFATLVRRKFGLR